MGDVVFPRCRSCWVRLNTAPATKTPTGEILSFLLPTGMHQFLSLGASRRHHRKSSPALTTPFTHTPAAVTHQTQHSETQSLTPGKAASTTASETLNRKMKKHKLHLKTEKNGHAVKSTRSIFLIQSIFLPSAGLHRGAQMHSGSLTKSIMKQTASGVYKQAE